MRLSWRVRMISILGAVFLVAFAAHDGWAPGRIGVGVYLQHCREWKRTRVPFTEAALREMATNACKNFVEDTLRPQKDNPGCFVAKLACSLELTNQFRDKVQDLCPPSGSCRAADAYYERGTFTANVDDPLPPQTWFCLSTANQELQSIIEAYFEVSDAATRDQLLRAVRTSNMDPAIIGRLEGTITECVAKKTLDDLIRFCSCGNGEVEPNYGEACDNGAANGEPNSDCSNQCTSTPAQLEIPIMPLKEKLYDGLKASPIRQVPLDSEPTE